MGTLSKLRRLVLRDNVSVREAAKRLNISRNTAKKYLEQPDMVEPQYAKRQSPPGLLEPYKEQLSQWLKTDSHRTRRDRRTVDAHYQAIRAMGYSGGKTMVYAFCRQWKDEQGQLPKGAGFIPLTFEPGEAFQFDWSTEYLLIGGLHRRLEVAHIKLAASRAYLLVAYYAQAHAMTGHYLFEADFCNVASGWEKGQVEKNVQDRRRHIWREAGQRRWTDLDELNTWLRQVCVDSWQELTHPEWGELSVADVWQQERGHLMALPKPFDGYVEQPARVTTTALIHFQRNRYSVPCEWVNAVVSLRAYASKLRLIGPGGAAVELTRSFDRDQTFYDWQHYIGLLERKPGALRNGAPFKEMPAPLQELQRQLLKNPGGDRVMAQVLSAVPLHGVEAVVVAAELALQAGRVSGEHVLNTLARLKESPVGVTDIDTPLKLQTPPVANPARYDGLRRTGVVA